MTTYNLTDSIGRMRLTLGDTDHRRGLLYRRRTPGVS